MSAVSGLLGTISLAGGYVTMADSWTLASNAALQDLTPLSPTSNHQQLMTTGLLLGAAGSYHCKLPVDAVAGYSVGSLVNPEEWSFFSACEAREVTPLGAVWRTYVTGLGVSGFECVAYVDASNPLIVAGTSGTATLTLTTGVYYSVPSIVSHVGAGVSADDAQRRIIVRAGAYAVPSAYGGLPLPGLSGACVLTASAGRTYSCTVLTTGVTCRVNRRMSQGDVVVEFVANGVVTPA